MAFQAVLSTAVAAIAVHVAYYVLLSPLRSFPGPFFAKVTNLWRFFDIWSGTSEQSQTKLHEKYGKAVRYGPNCVTLNDPELIRVIYASRGTWEKSTFYTVNEAVMDGKTVHSFLSVRDESLHSAMSKSILKLYSVANIVRYEPRIQSTIEIFLQQLESRFVDTKKPCPMHQWLHFVAWDAIAEITFSRRLGFLEQGKDIDNLIDTGRRMHEYMSLIGQAPVLDKVLAKNPIIPLGPPAFGAAAAFTAKQLASRVSQQDGHDPNSPDFLDEFLDIQRSKPGTTDSEVITWMLSNVVAGSDTTAISLRAVAYYLAKNDHCRKRLQAELDSADLGPTAQWKDVSKLPYLEAVMTEANRLHPGVACVLERIVPSGGLKLSDGRFIPAGTIVGINPFVVHRSPAVFGDDADDFRPERWLKDEQEAEDKYGLRVKKMREADLTFGFGKRGCFGKHVAIVEMKKILAELYRRYDIVLADPEKPWRIAASWFYFQEDMDMIVTRR